MLKVKDYKEWSKSFNNSFYQKMDEYFKTFPDADKRKNRIYFKLKVNPSKEIPIPYEIKEFLEYRGYRIIDYRRGLCDRSGREVRIGKVFNDLGQDHLLQVYADSKKELKNPDNLSVVISRHAYDCIGMSTGRGWSTCLDIYDKKYNGGFLHGLRGYLGSGCLVAYLIRDEDRNIDNPVSRITIKNVYDDVRYLQKENSCYGTYVPEFVNFVQNWVNDYNNKKRGY